MVNLWFTSDSHFFHENIITYAQRPFANAEEMNEAMVDRWNRVVRPQDHVYHLGDVTMQRNNQGRALGILDRLTGHKRLILGNHDHYAMKHYLAHFEKVMAMQRIGDLWFTHVPVHPQSLGSCKANVHGHIHANPSYPAAMRLDKKTQQVSWVPYVNICVEVTDYTPIHMDELQARVKAAQGAMAERDKFASVWPKGGINV